jgi:quercetin dioxygenase-like cupin family protein
MPGEGVKCASSGVPGAESPALYGCGRAVSRVIFPDDRTEVTVSGFDAGEGLSELQTSRSVIAQVVKGRLDFTADAEQLHAVPGSWLRTEPGTRHSLTAREPRVMLLTLIWAG